MRKKFFISYSHEDSNKVKTFALLLSLQGYDFWMDVKDVAYGDYYPSKILNGIHNADAYLVFLSKASLNSKWVNTEIDFALQEKVKRNNFYIIPVLLEEVEVPVSLSNINYIDGRFSLHEAVAALARQYKSNNIKHDSIVVSSVSFYISEETSVQIDPFNNSLDMGDLVEDRNRVLAELRKKAYGILLNFVPADNFDFQAEKPKFTNGIYEESVVKQAGSIEGSIRECITVETVVFNPSMSKVDNLLKNRLEVLNINAVTFGFSVPLKENESMMDIGKRCFTKIQNDYTIISYDKNEGAKIEIADDFYLSVAFTEELMRIKLSTKYSFQFKNKMKEFSLYDFIEALLK